MNLNEKPNGIQNFPFLFKKENSGLNDMDSVKCKLIDSNHSEKPHFKDEDGANRFRETENCDAN